MFPHLKTFLCLIGAITTHAVVLPNTSDSGLPQLKEGPAPWFSSLQRALVKEYVYPDNQFENSKKIHFSSKREDEEFSDIIISGFNAIANEVLTFFNESSVIVAKFEQDYKDLEQRATSLLFKFINHEFLYPKDRAKVYHEVRIASKMIDWLTDSYFEATGQNGIFDDDDDDDDDDASKEEKDKDESTE
ncbi:hypothetical protein OXX59_001560 [Metschnikowia pulcherrima]